MAQSYTMVCINVIAANNERDARCFCTSMQQRFINLRRGRLGPLLPPVEDIETLCSLSEQYSVDKALWLSVVCDAAQVKGWLKTLITEIGADKLTINDQIFDYQARLRSFEIAMAAREHLKD